MNAEMDKLRLERGDLLMEKQHIELNLKALKGSVVVKDEGDGPQGQVFNETQIKEECETTKMQMITCDFNMEEKQKQKEEAEAERTKEYSRLRQAKNEFEDKI
jgi:hypothetical protein